MQLVDQPYSIRERFINILSKISANQISVEAGVGEIEPLLKNGLMGKFEGYERTSVSFFIMCLDCFDPNKPPPKNFRDKWKMTSLRISGEPGHPREEIIKQAARLLKVLRGEETLWERIVHFFSN